MRPVQYFSKDYLEYCKKLDPEKICEFLESFQKLHLQKSQSKASKLISIRIPEDLLNAFKKKCAEEKIPYQTRIKELMRLVV